LVDYYKILGVGQTASDVEIKSAYRRLARQRHPDVNSGSTRAARDFAIIAIAYRTLRDPGKRAYYDAQRERLRHLNSFPPTASNPYLQRMRSVATQARMDRAIDDLFAADRRENLAFQQAVYPTVALFISSFLAALLRPYFWQGLETEGRLILLALFLAGVWHMGARLQWCLRRYCRPRGAQNPSGNPDSQSAYSCGRALVYIAAGSAFCFGIGLFIGTHTQYEILKQTPFFFDPHIHPELLFYPPIGVLVVDILHAIAMKLDF
jgi:curved DNA-binding protein CbpA